MAAIRFLQCKFCMRNHLQKVKGDGFRGLQRWIKFKIYRIAWTNLFESKNYEIFCKFHE
jgi:hypothetical protein